MFSFCYKKNVLKYRPSVCSTTLS